MGHEKTSKVFGVFLVGTCYFVGLGGMPLFDHSSAYALPISLGPFSDTAPFTDITRMGPNGAQVRIVKNPNTFGLSGAGVRVGQSEAGEPLATHNALNGFVTRRMVGAINAHATGVADILIGRSFTPAAGPGLIGVASGAQLFSGGGNYFDRTGFLVGHNVAIINMSSGFGGAGNAQSAETLFLDRTVRANNVLWTQAVDNSGPAANSVHRPEDSYNAIAVGATGANAAGVRSEDYTRVANYSARGTTADGRRKPDIVAPGSLISMAASGGVNADQINSGTSFAAPHVAGMAALLIERGTIAGLSRDHLSIKSVLLNSASKHVRDPNTADRTWPEFRAASGSDVPLDNAMGVGQLNGLAAVRQYQPGSRSDVGLQGGAIGAGQTRAFDLFVGGPALKPGSLVTATLVWDRPVTLKAGGNPTVAADYENTILPNLNLQLFRVGAALAAAQSNSGGINATGGDNVEHIYFNVRDEGKYQLRVENRAAVAVEGFGLTWSSGTSEGLSFSVDGGVFNTRAGSPGAQPLPRRGTGISPAPNPAEGLMAPFGNNRYPNDVNALGIAGPGNFPTEGEIFVANCNAVTSMVPKCDGRNMQRLSGALGTRSAVGPHNGPPAAMAVLNQGVAGLPAADRLGVLGLQPNDNIEGLSWGTDGTLGRPSVLLFSVDPDTQGERGDVRFQAIGSPIGAAPAMPFPDNPGGGNQFGGQEAAGDIFKSQKFDHFSRTYDSPLLLPARPQNNRLFIDEGQLGLQAPKGRGSLLGGEEDNLDALEMDSVLAVDPDGDGLHNKPVFFALDRWSPSLSDILRQTPDDIFVSLAPYTMGRFADGETDIHLTKGDALDALVLSDTFPFGLFNNNGDEALFSLDRFSPSVVNGSACSSEVYYTDFNREFRPRVDWKAGGSLFASADALGLMCTVDNIDALDIRRASDAVPEPSMFALFVIGLGTLVCFATRRK